MRIAIVGAGGVGGLVGGRLAFAGHDVTLIDGWPEHVEAIRREGLRLADPDGEKVTRPAALHLGEAQKLLRTPAELGFICVKLYDTDWGAHLLAPYLAPGAPLVTLQNALVEERIAAVVGWGRTIGCIGSSLYVGVREPGVVVRHRRPDPSYAVFRIGEIHGRVTARATMIAEALSVIDTAKVTTNLWGERWAKLAMNAMLSGASALSGMTQRQFLQSEDGRAVMIQIACEAVRVGQALGYEIEPVFGVPAREWLGDGHNASTAFEKQAAGIGQASTSGSAQDLAKGRRTEIDFFNGYIAARADELGIAAPVNRRIAEAARRCEAGEPLPGPSFFWSLRAAGGASTRP